MKSNPSHKKPVGKFAQFINLRWVISIFIATIFISSFMSFVSSGLLENATIAVSFVVLLVIIVIGIIFDIIGVAVTAADPSPFHSMAAKKRPAAKEALKLIENADKVSSFCNDVVGDICGVVSGSASAVIAARTIIGFEPTLASAVQLLMSALVAALTVGGKAIGKGFAMGASKEIVLITSTVIYRVKSMVGFPKNNK